MASSSSSSAQTQSPDVAIRFPPKTIGVTDNIRPKQQNIRIETNFWPLKFPVNSMTFHRYELKFFAEKANGKEVNLAQGLSNDASTELRRSCLVELYNQWLRDSHGISKSGFKSFVYDLGETLLSVEKLNLNDADQQRFVFDFTLNDVHKAYLPNWKRLYCVCKYVKEIKITNDLLKREDASLATSTTINERSMSSYIELILGQEMVLATEMFHVFAHSNFLREAAQGLTFKELRCKILKAGVAKSVQLCYKNPTQSQLLMQIAGKSGAFFPDTPLIDYLKSFLGSNNLAETLRIRDQRNKALKEIMNLTLITTHLRRNRIFMCKGFSTENFDNIFFERHLQREDGPSSKKEKISCFNYFQDKYKKTVSKGLPAVIDRVRRQEGGRMENYYPLDVCRIVSGQRFPHQKMTAEFQGELTRGTQKDPKDLKDTTEAVSKKGHLTHSNLHGKAFKVEIEKKPLSVNAELLHEPAIVWKNSIKDKEPWHQPPTDRKFLINGQCSSFVFANYLRALDQNNVLKFVKRIREQLQQRGTTLPDAQIVNVGDENGIKKLVKDDKPFFLMVVTRNKMDPIHGVLKHMETQSNVITQHVCTKTATAIINNQSNTLENFIMKTNEKLSGTNFNAKASNQFCQTNRKHAEIFQRGWMFLGIDFARGSPTIKEVKNGQPSVIGYVYNYNEQNSLASHCSYQTPAHTIKQDESVDLKFVNYVQNLNITPFIEDYHNRSNAKKWPTHIVIYRSGVPKAEFCNLIRHEKEAIKKSLVDLKKKHRDAPAIGFTIVIVQKDNKRLYPSNNKNPTPGTVIFTDIVSPNYDEFVLVSQRGIIGTAIPVTYTVIADEPTHCKRVNVKELATITFFLAHLHNNVLGTTTLPSVLHHAVQITKRARNNMRYEVYGSIDDNASSTSTGVGRRQMDTDEENCNRLTQNLQFKSNTKFWA